MKGYLFISSYPLIEQEPIVRTCMPSNRGVGGEEMGVIQHMSLEMGR